MNRFYLKYQGYLKNKSIILVIYVLFIGIIYEEIKTKQIIKTIKMTIKDLEQISDYLENNQDDMEVADYIDFLQINEIRISRNLAIVIFENYLDLNPMSRNAPNFNLIEYLKARYTS